MIAAVKNVAARLVGVERKARSHEVPTLDREALDVPVKAAEERAEVANQQHRDSMTRVDELKAQIRDAEAAFDRDGSEDGADQIVKLKRELERRELFGQRTQRAAVTAAGELEQAIAARNAALLAHFEERANGAHVRLRALWLERGLSALKQFEEFVAEADAIVSDAQAANAEARALTRGNSTDAHARAMGLEALRSVVSSWITDALDAGMRVRIEGLFR